MAKKSEKKMAIEIPVTEVKADNYKAIQFNRQSSVFTDRPTTDYMTIERFCSERLFRLYSEQKQFESIRSQNRLTFQIDEDHEQALKINAIIGTGLFSIQQAIDMVCVAVIPKTEQKKATTKPDKESDEPIDWKKVHQTLTGKTERKNLTKKEKSAYGKLQAYYQALNNPVPQESLWYGVTGNLEHDKAIASKAFDKAVQVAKKKIEAGIPGIEVPTNKMNYTWYTDTVKKYAEKIAPIK